MDAKLLESAGLTEGETKVYMTLLKLGETKTGPLAKEAEVSSSKVYKILDRLIKKGLVGHATKGDTKYFSALEPKRILELMNKKEEELKEKKSKIEKMIPFLESERESSKKPKTTVYEGIKAVENLFKNILDDLKKGDEYFVIGARYGGYRDHPGLRDFFHNYHTQRAKRGIKVKMLANHGVILEKPTGKISEIKYLPQQFFSNMQITFYKKKVFIIIWERDFPTAFQIESEEAVKSFQSYFDAFWKISKK